MERPCFCVCNQPTRSETCQAVKSLVSERFEILGFDHLNEEEFLKASTLNCLMSQSKPVQNFETSKFVLDSNGA